MLIIKKPKDAMVEKNFARIFRADNLMEFKSPGDYLSVRDFYKVYGYACQYAALTKDADIGDLTISFVGNRYPRELIKHLRELRGYVVEEEQAGIYRVTGDFLPIQILETKKLAEPENLWLKGLVRDLEVSTAKRILEESSRKKRASMGAFLDVVLRANPQTIQEVLAMTEGALTIEDVLWEAGYIPRWEENGREKGREEGQKNILDLLKQGYTVEQIEKMLASRSLSPAK
ncbi:MAG: hypothetical protein LBQ46_01515 [Treponema sp.]|nr:hypothetical protein [Treponema sp.]